jgi:isoleucyl-tRNA synthetase
MSKSLGNGIEPQDIIKNLGADILRLWILSTDYRNEMSLSDEILRRTADAYRRIRNTARFLLGNLHGFDPAAHAVAHDRMLLLDQWVVQRTAELQAEIVDAYERYDFAAVVGKVQNFCTGDLGALYLDVTKDRLYTMPAASLGRRSAPTAMFHVAEAFVRWIAPVLSFTADEIWRHLPGAREDNVLFATWYAGLAPVAADRAAQADAIAPLLAIREGINAVLEPMRADGRIGASLQAEVAVYTDEAALAAAPDGLADEAKFLFITSAASFRPAAERPADAAAVEGVAAWVVAAPSAHGKCVRCWHFRSDVGAHADDPELCGRCVGNVYGDGENRRYF